MTDDKLRPEGQEDDQPIEELIEPAPVLGGLPPEEQPAPEASPTGSGSEEQPPAMPLVIPIIEPVEQKPVEKVAEQPPAPVEPAAPPVAEQPPEPAGTESPAVPTLPAEQPPEPAPEVHEEPVVEAPVAEQPAEAEVAELDEGPESQIVLPAEEQGQPPEHTLLDMGPVRDPKAKKPEGLEGLVDKAPPREDTVVVEPGALESETKLISAGKMLGSYVIIKQLAQGGMGKIWIAVDPFAVLELKMLEDGDSDPNISKQLSEAKVANGESEPSKRGKIEAYLVQKRLNFTALSEEERLQYVLDNRKWIMDPRVPRVVLKTTLDAARLSRFKREINICRELNHPNLVKIFGYGEERGIHYAVIEYVEGKDLDKLRLMSDKSSKVIQGVLEGLIYAHDKKILHRDIKPANIFVSDDFKVVKLADFGLAKDYSQSASWDPKETGSQDHVLGTPQFMSPEQARGEFNAIGEKSDVFSLGATFYKALTGKPPAQGSNTFETLNMIGVLLDDPPWVRELKPEVSEELEDLVMMMLSKDINMRLSTAETKELLGKIVSEKRFDYRPITREESNKKAQERRKLESEISKLSGAVAKLSRSGKTPEDLFMLARKYESAGEIYARGEGISLVSSTRKNGTSADGEIRKEVEEKVYKSLRLNAFEHAVAHYEEYFRTRRSEKLTQEQLMIKQFTLPLLIKKVELEKRRLKRIVQQVGVKPPSNKMKFAGIAALVAAGLFGISSYFILDHKKQNRIEEQIVAIEKAQTSKDYKLAYAKLSEAENDVKDYASSHILNQKLKELRALVQNSDNFDKASALYASAKASALDKSDFAASRNSLEEALITETKLSDEFKGKLDLVKVNTASELYNAMRKMLEGRKYSEASVGIDAIRWFLNKIAPRSEEHAKLIESLKEKIRSDEPEIFKRIGDIRAFQGMVGDLLNTVSADYAKLEIQLKADKFFKRTELNGLDEKLVKVSEELLKIDPNAVGPEDYNKRKSSIDELKVKIQALGMDLDTRQIAYLKKVSKELGDIVGSIEDYTNDDSVQKIKVAKASMDAAKEVYANVGQNVAELKAVEDQLNSADTRLRDLDEKAAAYPKFLRLAKDGSDSEKRDARSNLVKNYVDVGRLAEAEKVLNDISDKTGLEAYVAIVEFEKKVADASLRVKRTPFGLDQSVIDGYSASVDAYKADISKGDKLAASLLELYVKTNIDVKNAEGGIKTVKALNDRVLELKDLIKTDPKQEYLLELQEKEKSFADKQGALHKQIGDYLNAAKVILDNQGRSLPPLDMVKQLSEAYRAAKYPKRADAVIERFK